MRLAFLTHEPFYPPTGGGSAEAVYLVQELVRRGHDVHLFCPTLPDADEVAARFGVTLHPFSAWRMGRYTSWRNAKYLLYPFFLERLVARAARHTRFDAVLGQHAIAAVAAGRLKRRLRVPVVLNFLDHLTGFMETWPAWLMPPPVLAVLKRFELSLPHRYDADLVLTVSDTLADYFAQAGCDRARLRPIYYGYDAALFPFDDAALLARTDAPPTFVMHGSLDHHHLRDIALDAFARVQEQCPAARFKLVGQRTAALAAFQRRAATRLRGQPLECPGFIPYADVARHLATASVGLVPYEESRGTHCAFVAKTVEYLALGLPVVCTPLDSARRYFHDEPLVRFASFDGRDFGERMLGWLAVPAAQRAELGRAAAARVRARLDWRTVCGRAVEAVEEAVEQACRSGGKSAN